VLRCVCEGDVRHFVGCQIGCWVLRRDSGGCPASSGGRPCLPWRSPARTRARRVYPSHRHHDLSASSATSSATSPRERLRSSHLVALHCIGSRVGLSRLGRDVTAAPPLLASNIKPPTLFFSLSMGTLLASRTPGFHHVPILHGVNQTFCTHYFSLVSYFASILSSLPWT